MCAAGEVSMRVEFKNICKILYCEKQFVKYVLYLNAFYGTFDFIFMFPEFINTRVINIKKFWCYFRAPRLLIQLHILYNFHD